LTAVILQARIDSSRLPGKALLPLGGKPLLFRVMQALNFIHADLRVLACTDDSFNEFKPLAEEAGFQIHAGPKDDVLERYCQVIRKYSIERVIRATGDNPFVFSDAASLINYEACALNAAYAGYLELPYGAGVESVAASALLQAAQEAALPYEREHVCPFLYNHPELFKIHRPSAPVMWNHSDIRLTVDTQEDYEMAVELYSALKDAQDRFCGETIIKTFNGIN